MKLNAKVADLSITFVLNTRIQARKEVERPQVPTRKMHERKGQKAERFRTCTKKTTEV